MRRLRTAMRLWFLTVVLLVIGSASVRHGGPAAQSTAAASVFHGGRLIVGDGSAPVENATFVVEQGRITRVGRAGSVQEPAGATRVDLTGKTVMPAIVDTHVHMATTREALTGQLQRKAFWGVAAVLSLGQDTGDVAFQIRRDTVPNGARLLTAGRGLTMPEPGRTEAPYWVTSEAEARTAVRELAVRQVDFVKIWVDDRGGTVRKMPPEIYGAVIDEAHRNALRVTAHLFTLEDAKGLLRAGVDAFAHGVRDRDIDDEFVALMKARPHVVLAPNLPDRGVATDYRWLTGSVPADELKQVQASAVDSPALQKAFGIQARNLARLNAAGVRIAFGTDGNVAWRHHVEMEDMVSAGMTPHQVIVAATKTSADLLRLTDLGTIQAGKSADFVVLDANPLDDISNTRRIAAVYLRGAAVDRQALKARLGARTP